ncbi:formate dehydrogenase [Paenalcaligenes hominis]|uniref:Formate dehydrogenase n=1 Tax=Paenalcaligenes hominis TaxID=643674 RepID=A0A1U9K1X1_9BURK|nr:formate dehydrogenase subunit delta [Paenalcaligenes hominis]AQS51939.1 formate dehydrogenase [Paenalcaligenes hominis]
MHVDPLIPMLNQIGAFFEAQPNPDASTKAVADHVRLFWEPRMRESILRFLDQYPEGKSSEHELLPIVVNALTTYREELTPSSRV